MRTKYFIPFFLLLFLVLALACSSDETKDNAKTEVASRPTVPIMANDVQIGAQIWMTKNLNIGRYRNGDIIPQVTDPNLWSSTNYGAWCYYANNSANGTIYGKLYNWYAINDLRGFAPLGYHVPSYDEWYTLITFLGGGVEAGRKMKEIGITHWNGPNTLATNSSGFTALPGGGGYAGGFGFFFGIGQEGIWWSTSEYDDTGESFTLFMDFSDVGLGHDFKNHYYSVRCLKN